MAASSFHLLAVDFGKVDLSQGCCCNRNIIKLLKDLRDRFPQVGPQDLLCGGGVEGGDIVLKLLKLLDELGSQDINTSGELLPDLWTDEKRKVGKYKGCFMAIISAPP